MSRVGAPRHDPVLIGQIAEPPFACVPDPLTLFAARAQRFRSLAEGHALLPYCVFSRNKRCAAPLEGWARRARHSGPGGP